MRDGGIGAEEDAFDPTEDGGVGADAEGKAQNRQQRKSRAAAQHPQCIAQIQPSGLNHGQPPLFAVDLRSLLNAAEISKRFTARVGGRHAFAQVQFSRHLQVRTQLIVHVVLQTAAAEERSETLDNTSEGRAHKLRSP